MIKLHEILKHWLEEDEILKKHFFIKVPPSPSFSPQIQCRCTYVDVSNGKVRRPDDYRDIGKGIAAVDDAEVRVYKSEILPAGDPHFFEKLKQLLLYGEMHFEPDSQGDLKPLVCYDDHIASVTFKFFHDRKNSSPSK